MTYYEDQKLHDEKCEHCEHHGASGDGGKMSNARQETIADIVADMREFADADSQTIGRDVLRIRIQNFARRIEAAAKREVAELRECLKEAIREKCPFTRMSCNHGELCDYECGTVKWRNALREKGGAK